jgi:hypothetical protein
MVPTDMKEGENAMYRIAKSRDRKTMNMIKVKCIKNEIERFLKKMKISRIYDVSISINYSIKRVGAHPLSKIFLQMTSLNILCIEFKNLGSKVT